MRLILMYHQVANPRDLNQLVTFQRHLSQLAKRYPIVLPQDPFIPGRLSLSLTFDDAYYDFYHFVFPLLQRLKIKAVLGIPTAFIQAETDLSPEKRLQVAYPYALRFPEQYEKKVPLCTWAEIREMVQSGWVYPASHGHLHLNLTCPKTDLKTELLHSRQSLENHLACPIDTFIYPFGKMTKTVHQQVHRYYPHALRIGSGLNFQAPKNGLWYRVPADPFFNSMKPQTLSWPFLAKLSANGFFNRLRQK